MIVDFPLREPTRVSSSIGGRQPRRGRLRAPSCGRRGAAGSRRSDRRSRRSIDADGSLDHPFNPLSVAIGAEASFVARAIDTDKKGLTEVLGAAARHRGSAFVEILQNCNIYNDGAFDVVREEKEQPDLPPARRARSASAPRASAASSSTRTARCGSSTSRRPGENSLLVHDAAHAQPSLAFALSRITYETDGAVPLGVFRALEQPVYDDLMSEQLDAAREQRGEGDLAALLHSGDTWVVPG